VTSSQPRSGAEIRARLDHPVIDADGHVVEFLPAVLDEVRSVAGAELAEQLDAVLRVSATTRGLSNEQKRALGLFRLSWWAFPARNTLDRATATLPRLQYERLDELGIDYAALFPTFGLAPLSVDDEELRRAGVRGVNRYLAASYGEFSDRLSPAAVIPMHTPEEAIEELDFAVGELGLKNAVLAGHVRRPVPIEDPPRTAYWIDNFALDSEYDYDPVWARCQTLGIAPSFHSSGMGWPNRSSPTSYVYNHLGNFAVAGEHTCRSLFLGGVPRRFPGLRFAFLEGGIAWACNLYSDLVGHFEKRGRGAISQFDPREMDTGQLRELFAKYAPSSFTRHLGEVDRALTVLSDPDEDPAGVDEFAASGIDAVEDIRDVFTESFYFGCEADDPMNATAFHTRANPLGAVLRPIFGSDIGHWDVPDMRGVLGEAFELVERQLLDEAQLREFLFANPARLWADVNPGYFEGTVVEAAVRDLLAD
jgi:predicted TIM-barrel fold metal-dependent hydrolase